MQFSPEPELDNKLRRVLVVARHEFWSTVSRVGYIVTLIGMPIALVVITLLPALSIALSGGPQALTGLKDPDEVTVIGLVDEASPAAASPEAIAWHNQDQALAAEEKRALSESPSQVDPASWRDSRDRGGFQPDARVEVRRYSDEEAATQAVRTGEADAVWIFPSTYWRTPDVTILIGRTSPTKWRVHPGHRAIIRLARTSIAERTALDQASKDRLIKVLETEYKLVGLEGEADTDARTTRESFTALLMPAVFGSFFAFIIFVASGYLLDSVGEEKETRILEILLASVTPEDLLLGKMLGLGVAGLLQTLLMALLGLGPLIILGSLTLGLGQLLAMFVCAALGYAMYASLMGASGAIASNRIEGRQTSAAWTITASLPFFLFPVFIVEGEQLVAVVLSLFPLTAPVAMILRLGAGAVPAWQLMVSLATMTATAWLAWRFGSRVFRIAILMTGSRPPLRTIWSWIRTG